MKKLKKFYKNNRIYCILMGISIFCLALIAMLFVVYFVNQTKNDTYGNRLNGIESMEISDSEKDEIVNVIKENDKVDKATVNIKGKIIYVNVYLLDGNRDLANSIAVKVLNTLNEEKKDFYDINFSFNKDDDEAFPFMGYKKSDATIISWSKVSD